MALGNPLSCLQQAFARLLARFHKKFLTFRSSFVGARFDAAVNRSDVSGLIDQAVTRYAREIGLQDPPPQRTA